MQVQKCVKWWVWVMIVGKWRGLAGGFVALPVAEEAVKDAA